VAPHVIDSAFHAFVDRLATWNIHPRTP
jgi:hypothetical protein